MSPVCDERGAVARHHHHNPLHHHQQQQRHQQQPHRRRAPQSSRRRPPASSSLSAPARLLSAVAFASLLAAPAAAVRIAFSNCLPDSYRFNNPPPLQWEPLYADAVFDTEHDSHNLQMIVWGNVTGQQNQGKLPPADSPYWTDDTMTNGKIIQLEEGSNVTTLYRKVNVLTYEPWNQRVDFCLTGLVNGSCPLSPVFNLDNLTIPYGLPSISLSHDFDASYAFTSFSPTFIIIEGNTAATNIGCISATITPSLGHLAVLLKFLPLVVLVLTGFAVTFASIFSPWGSTDVFHWTSNYGRDGDLLRLVTPGFGDCLQYIQFIALTGGLSVSYPGFYQPIVSQVAWSNLMFNESFVTHADPYQSVVDGIYVTNGTYGMQHMGQLVGMAKSQDIWAGMMVWLCALTVAVSVLAQAGFFVQWVFRRVKSIPEEDLRAKNIPFSIGNIVRIMFNYFLLPIVALSTYQLVLAADSPAYTVALAAVTLVLLAGFAAWLLFLIIRTRPKSVLFDDLPTVLRYGPLYNTYSDDVAAFALIAVLLTCVRGIAIGAVQPSGVAQVVLLAICEVIHILSLHAFRPFSSPTSMNAYHTLLSSLRLITIMLMVAFVPTLGVTDGSKGWIGYVVLVLHGCVLVFIFFLNALQTTVEVAARMLGAGGDNVGGQTRGGLTKIFGMRQLSRRVTHREGPSRASQLSTSAMLDVENGSKAGYTMPDSRLRSESAASIGALAANHRHRSSSAFDSVDMYSGGHRHVDSNSSYVPGTPGGESSFSFLPSPSTARHPVTAGALESADPYYRPPRRRRETLNESIHSDVPPGIHGTDSGQLSQLEPPGPVGDAADVGAEISRGTTPAPPGGATTANVPINRPDYSTREVDFYYGVRGPALNSDGPGRKLGTGPADPTGPMATATGWFRTMIGGKSKEKGKGFEVVRSSRMPPAMMARNGAFGDETPPEGIPVAMGVLRNGPIDSDDSDDEPGGKTSPKHRDGDLLTDEGDPQESDADEPDDHAANRSSREFPRGRATSSSGGPVGSSAPRLNIPGIPDVPGIPRKSSKRNSAMMDSSRSRSPDAAKSAFRASPEPSSGERHPAGAQDDTLSVSQLPFSSSESQKRLSSNSSMDFPGEFTQVDLQGGRSERPVSYGVVPQHGINRVDPGERHVDLLGTSAELVNEEETPRKRA